MQFLLLGQTWPGKGGHSRREDAEQLLPVGDVRYCGLSTVEEEQEDVAGVSAAPVDLLGRLLGEGAHDPLHPATRQRNRHDAGVTESNCAEFI